LLGNDQPQDDLLSDDRPWPDPLDEAAYHGLAGEIVRAIEPASEADPVALLVSLLVGVGSLIGRTAYFLAEADHHYPHEFAVLAGQTSKGRKGTSWGHVQRLLARVDELVGERIVSGLSSAEGLLWRLRDAITKREKIKKNGEVDYQDVEADPGILDKRLLVIEQEFASLLKRFEQTGNSLSMVLRTAWDGREILESLTKNSPARVTGAHVSLLGHVTVEEVRRYLTTTEVANGFGNRHLWICVRRSKLLPDGGQIDSSVMDRLGKRLQAAVEFAQRQHEMRRDEQARQVWHAVYGKLSEGRPGLSGALLGRAEVHVMRLALIYALLDHSTIISGQHLLAGLAIWKYAEQSVRCIFGTSVGDPLADELLRLIGTCKDGLTRTDINRYLGTHVKAADIGRGLGVLLSAHLIHTEKTTTGGRPVERFHVVQHG
jgi:hypothetical protein